MSQIISSLPKSPAQPTVTPATCHLVDHGFPHVPLHDHGQIVLLPGGDDDCQEELLNPGAVGGFNLVDHVLPLVPLHKLNLLMHILIMLIKNSLFENWKFHFLGYLKPYLIIHDNEQ